MAEGKTIAGAEFTAGTGFKALRCWPKGPHKHCECLQWMEEDDHESQKPFKIPSKTEKILPQTSLVDYICEI